MNFILAWLMKPKVLLAVILAAVLTGGILWYGNKRESAGYSSGQRNQLQVDQSQFQSVLKQYQDSLNAAQLKIAADDKQFTALQAQISTLNASLSALAIQRESGQQSINKLPDTAVQGDLEMKLSGPLTDPTTLRKADAIVTDYPLVLKSVDVLSAKVDDLSQSVSVLQDKVGQVTVQRDSAVQFGNTVVGYYVKAYNAAQVHHSKFIKIITFGIVRDRHLDLPQPTTLHVPDAH